MFKLYKILFFNNACAFGVKASSNETYSHPNVLVCIDIHNAVLAYKCNMPNSRYFFPQVVNAWYFLVNPYMISIILQHFADIIYLSSGISLCLLSCTWFSMYSLFKLGCYIENLLVEFWIMEIFIWAVVIFSTSLDCNKESTPTAIWSYPILFN